MFGVGLSFDYIIQSRGGGGGWTLWNSLRLNKFFFIPLVNSETFLPLPLYRNPHLDDAKDYYH